MPRRLRSFRPPAAGSPARPGRRGLRRRSLLAVVPAALVAACAPRGSGPPAGGRGPSGATSPGSTPPGTPRMPGEILLDWLTTGGFAGVHRRTLLYADGTYTLDEEGEPSRTGRIPAADAATVRALLDEAGLGRQPRRSTGPGADRFQYRIAYDGHVVHRDETTLGEPLRKVRALVPVG